MKARKYVVPHKTMLRVTHFVLMNITVCNGHFLLIHLVSIKHLHGNFFLQKYLPLLRFFMENAKVNFLGQLTNCEFVSRKKLRLEPYSLNEIVSRFKMSPPPGANKSTYENSSFGSARSKSTDRSAQTLPGCVTLWPSLHFSGPIISWG